MSRIDGRPVDLTRGLAPVGTAMHVDLPRRDCDVSLIAENANGPGEPDTIHVHWAGAVPAAQLKPVLWVLSIGIAKYPQPGWTLGLPAKDATDLSAAFRQQLGGFYSDVKTTLLTNEQATRGTVLRALSDIRSNAKEGDFAVVFLSGHGVADTDKTYYYLPVDFVKDDYLTGAVSFDDITKIVSGIKARTVLFIDTCRSGGLNEARLSAIADINSIAGGMSDASNGLVVFTAATGQQSALESPAWGNGAFTKAIIEGLSGAAVDRNGQIRISGLDGYVSRRVGDLTCGKQTPVCAKRVPDFSIGQASPKDEPATNTCPN